jgi:uncharacterized protein YndB with AHSA1/START domain
MKIILFILAGLVAIIVLMFAIGVMLPKAHTAAVRIALRAPAQNVYDAIADVERGTTWRTGLKQVEVLEREPLRWRETADWGKLTFVREEAVPPSRIVARIADESEGFGGTWTYEIATSPNQAGSTVTITENGTVANPMFRFMSRFVFGQYRSLETYARDLAKHLGESAEPTRLN